MCVCGVLFCLQACTAMYNCFCLFVCLFVCFDYLIHSCLSVCLSVFLIHSVNKQVTHIYYIFPQSLFNVNNSSRILSFHSEI